MSARSTSARGFTLVEIVVALALLMILITMALVYLQSNAPQPRPVETVADALTAAVGKVLEWREGFIGNTPHIDDPRCAEAKALMDRARGLLAEYAAHPDKDQGVLDAQTAELDALMPTLRRWCQTAFPTP